MKKLLQISFVIVYLFITTGFTVTLHFCGGEVSDVSIVRTHGDEDPCGCVPDSCEDSCCNDEIQTIKLTDLHKSEVKFSQNSFELVNAFSIAKNILPSLATDIDFYTNNFHYDSGPPPLYLQNCSFLI